MEMRKALWVLIFTGWAAVLSGQPRKIDLNGTWEYGLERNYQAATSVPGVPLDPGTIGEEKLWYRRTVELPGGNWDRAVLELKGARFRPEVYVDGQRVSAQPGGMIRSYHPLAHRNLRPGRTVTLEIALEPLANVPESDASYIPKADQWRSNVSACLWDDVVLHLDGGARIERIVPYSAPDQKRVSLHYEVEGRLQGEVRLDIFDRSGNRLLSESGRFTAGKNEMVVDYGETLRQWSPDQPNLYRMRMTLLKGGKEIDFREQNLGIKVFSEKDKQFYLNGEPCRLRGGTVVWHRWMRDAEGRDVGYDTEWFGRNVVQRLKDHGANYLRFHLGVPPERLLDLCDEYGLLVQYEWSFFHGMPASYESLMDQYPRWFDLAMEHPSIALYHPYNETEGEQLETAWQALDRIVEDYPPLVLAERDVLHVHKYWWSLFENVGLYYDSAGQFPQAIMVDEFGGNYLDGYGEMGGYRSLKESYLRFLGRNSTPEMRLAHLDQSNGRIAEYWRRIGAAGVAPFTIASSWEDGNTWFLGRLREEKPKTVWNALTPAWSPVAVSLDLWDRNFVPGQRFSVPLCWINDTDISREIQARVTVSNADGKRFFHRIISHRVGAFSQETRDTEVAVPETTGEYRIAVELLNPPEQVKYPVRSEWDIRVWQAVVPDQVRHRRYYVPNHEKELVGFLQNHGLKRIDDPKGADMILLSRGSWNQVAGGDGSLSEQIRQAIDNGTSVLLLDVGERYLGQGYPAHEGDLGPLQGVARVTDPVVTSYELFPGLTLNFTEAAEPESHLHPAPNLEALWREMPLHYTWLWNGMRGGLLSPAADMEIHGMQPEAFLEQWKARGADPERIRSGRYYAYELYGFYEYTDQPQDRSIQSDLRKKVEFLVEDAPALAGAINPSTPVKVTDLAEAYRLSRQGTARGFTVLATAGKNLTRTPVVRIDFGEGKGEMILSQLLTAGRLAEGFGEPGLYGIRYDETAVQLVLNMMDELTR